MYRRLVCCLAILACSLALASRAHAAEVCVPSVAIDVSCDSEELTINAAITAANPGDTVLVDVGIYTEFVVINKNIALLSTSGRAATTIRPPATPTATLGTVRVTTGSNGVQIGAPGQGFTIEGIDNASPGIESAALYLQGAHANAEIRNNEIIAAGDAALTAEFGQANTGWVIDGNTFSGQTFTGLPADFGFANQFTTPNVPRQVVVMGDGGGAGIGASSNITFTNNLITATAGGINGLGQEQGNNLVTIDSANSTIISNTFQGVTTRFAVSLRTRRPGVAISGNTFVSTGLVSLVLTTPGTAHVFVQNGSTTAAIYGANTFDRAAYVAAPAVTTGSVAVGPALTAAEAAAGSTIEIQTAVYRDQVRVTKNNIVVNGNGAILKPSALVTDTAQGSPCSNGNGTAILLVSGVTGVVLNNLNIDGALITAMPARMVGLYYRNASGTINGGSVKNVRNTPLDGSQNGLGLYVQAKGPNIADVDVIGVTVSGIQKNGVTFNGCGCADTVDGIATGSVTGSAITGEGNTPLIGQNGIQVGFGAGPVQISGNAIIGHRYTGNPANGTASGVLLFSTKNNVVDTNEILDGNSGVVIQGGSFGLCVAGDSTGNTVSCNRIEGHNQFAYEAGVSSDAAANTIDSNSISDNTTGVDGTAITSGNLDAENNWWGAANGPSGVGPGSGDAVTVNVDFTPFLTAVPACVECTSNAQCDDGLACTGSETCSLGVCQTGTPVTCTGECKTGVCLEPTGLCQLDPDGTVCSGAPDACSVSDFCTSGLCTEGGSGDPDGDGICSTDDNCPAISNASQADLDNDDIGDPCDPDDAALNVTRARVKRNSSLNPAKPNGLVKVSGDMIVNLPGGDSLVSPTGFAVRVVDSLTLDTNTLASPPVWTAAQCTVKTVPGNGVIRTIVCKSADKNSTLVIRAINPVNPVVQQVYKFTITLRRVAVVAPFDSPVSTSLKQGAIDRVGTILDCQSNQAGLTCKEG